MPFCLINQSYFWDVQEFQSQLLSMDSFESKPLKRVKVGLIRETLEQGVDSGVNVNLVGLPAIVLPYGLVEGGLSGLPVGPQMIGAAFDEEKLLKVGDIFEQTLKGSGFVPTMLQNVA
ncbi:hypothetical protein Bca52824_027854 [Brassica carinata]|uniref:Amidase domain-containing protein n=1 Tax=Brassica carinata TaxID=52824 RepID=A0A8X7VBC8_BRACI|nr:hypothetical protein Bca52824_027854 [Brassica carinata]